MNTRNFWMGAVVAAALSANAAVLPPPVVVVRDLRGDEKPVAVEQATEAVAGNGLYKRIRTRFTFTNPNARQMSADFEFPIPDGATVCGYALEVNGVMVPGVVVEKEKARVAFETEKAKGVDPGLVEHAAGNVWRTRIFPLLPNTPRRAEVDYIVPLKKPTAEVVWERDGEDVFVGMKTGFPFAIDRLTDLRLNCGNENNEPLQSKIENRLIENNNPVALNKSCSSCLRSFAKGVILWDASASAEAHKAAWRAKLEALPDDGTWRLVVFRNDAEDLGELGKPALLAAIDGLIYDGGTDIGNALEKTGFTGLGKEVQDSAQAPDNPVHPTKSCPSCLLFTDELDTLSLVRPDYEDNPNIIIASRDGSASRAVSVRRVGKGEAPPPGVEVKEGALLATAWAADRIADLSAQAESRKAEFLALGRRYGVASPVTSLIVLERLDQYLTHKIEPPASLSFHDEWVRRRAAQDDEIAKAEANAEHRRDLLRLWKERVEWWLNPIPPKRTPKSGLFDDTARASRAPVPAMAAEASAPIRTLSASRVPNAVGAATRGAATMGASLRSKSAAAPREAGGGGATITLRPWTPDAPYLKKLAAAADPYAKYLSLKKEYGSSPAFYMDVASWFWRQMVGSSDGQIVPPSDHSTIRPFDRLAKRILSNMAEFGLDDAKVWRAMGWKLREEGCYEEAIRCFRHALRLRGEEGQSRRDLALVLAEYGKRQMKNEEFRMKNEAASGGHDSNSSFIIHHSSLAEAARLLHEAAFTNWARRSARRSNDRQVSILALEELNALLAWCEAAKVDVTAPEMDVAYRRDLPVKIRIVLSWDADETDIDIHVLEPDGEEAYYGHRRTSSGGFVGEDVTTGYGPEEYLRKEGAGVFKVLTNYFASHQTALTGAVTAMATVYTDWGTAAERMKILTLRLDKPKDKHLVGEVTVE